MTGRPAPHAPTLPALGRRRFRRRPAGPRVDGLAALGPDLLEVRPRAVRVGDEWCATFTVVGYPREVGPGWLGPLTAHPDRLDVAVHITPVPAAVAADRLRRQLARLESSRRTDTARGRLVDPEVEVAAEDARDLSAALARGQQRLFRVSLVLTVHAPDEAALSAACGRVRAVASSLLLTAHPASYRSLQGWVSTLPIGLDPLAGGRSFDTAALAASFPFAATGLPAGLSTGVAAGVAANTGVLYGRTATGAGLVRWDRFGQDNHNSVILARSGAGKSYLAKLECLRSLYDGVQVAVIDPEDEYARLAAAVGGSYLHLGAPGVRLNPFDLDTRPDALIRRTLFLHTLIGVLLGEPLDPPMTAALDRGILATYARVGIGLDPRTHRRPAPLLADLARALADDTEDDTSDDTSRRTGAGTGAAGRELAARLAPYVTGSHAGLFAGPTSTHPDGHLVVFSLRDLPDQLKPAGTLLTLDAIWRHVADPTTRARRLVIVDEAWLLMRDPEGARFLFRLAKAARKHWCGLTVVTQDAADLLGSELGQAVVANAATQILLRQAPQTIDALADAFHLSAGEQSFLLSAPRGHGLLAGGTDRVAFRTIASPAEHALVTTDPAELAADQPDP